MGAGEVAAGLCVELGQPVGIRYQRLAPEAADPDQRMSRQEEGDAGPRLGPVRNQRIRGHKAVLRPAEAIGLGCPQAHPAPRRDPQARCQRQGLRGKSPTGPEHGLRPGVAGQNPVAGPQGADRTQPARNRHKTRRIVCRRPEEPPTVRMGGIRPCVGRRVWSRERRHAPALDTYGLAKPQCAEVQWLELEEFRVRKNARHPGASTALRPLTERGLPGSGGNVHPRPHRNPDMPPPPTGSTFTHARTFRCATGPPQTVTTTPQ
jgi:hypothetical protein